MKLSKEHNFYEKFTSIPGLERDTENLLIKEAQKGNKEAENKVLFHNIKVIIETIKPCKCNYRYDENDLFQESIIGMTKAIHSFNPQKDLPFKTYSLYYIRKYISQYINNNNLAVRVPLYMQLLFKRIKKIEHYYLLENNYNYPSTQYYSKELGIPENVIKRCIKALEKDEKIYHNDMEENDET